MSSSARNFGLVLLTTLAWGCDLPTIPSRLEPPPPEVDMGSEDMEEPLLCEPGQRTCFASSVRICSEDGRAVTSRVCAASQVCREGECVDARETCEEDDVSLAISQTKIFFEVDEDLKPTSTSFTLTNCERLPLRIQKASVISPAREDGSLVFDFDLASGSPQGVTLDPGVALTTKLLFRPRDRHWIERGTLYLTVEGGADVLTREVEMLTSAWCVSVTPERQLGLLQRGEEAKTPVKVHNCGSRSVLLSGANLRHADPDLEWRISGLEKPMTLQPGQALDLDVAFVPRRTGEFDASVEVVLNPQDEEYLSRPLPRTLLRGRVVEGELDCHETSPEVPDVFRIQAGEDGSYPLTLYAIASPDPPEDWSVHHDITSLQDFGPPPLYRALDASPNITWMLPYTGGAYRIETSLIDSLGVPSCEQATRAFEVAPEDPYYIELTWDAPGDALKSDEGDGLGVDLDLHARFITEQGQKGRWNTRGESCFGRLGGCAAGVGEVRMTSASGGLPEAIAVLDTQGMSGADIGVHIANANLYTSSCARLRVWRSGELIAQVPGDSSDALGCIDGRSIQGTNSFWYIGRVDFAKGVLDQNNQAILPRGFPRD